MSDYTLTVFADGDALLAQQVNDNFQYCLADTTAKVGALQTSVQGSINSIDASIGDLQTSVSGQSSSISDLQTGVSNANTKAFQVLNYSGAIGLSFSTLTSGYTAPSKGAVYLYNYPPARNTNKLYVNNVDISQAVNGPSSDADFANITVLLDAGDVIKFGNGGASPREFSACFVPSKGV